jgi:hypothetical protein
MARSRKESEPALILEDPLAGSAAEGSVSIAPATTPQKPEGGAGTGLEAIITLYLPETQLIDTNFDLRNIDFNKITSRPRPNDGSYYEIKYSRRKHDMSGFKHIDVTVRGDQEQEQRLYIYYKKILPSIGGRRGTLKGRKGRRGRHSRKK